MKISVPNNADKALDVLTSSGYEAYVVGGCVRDAYLGLTPSDWDVTTSAAPDEIKKVFENCRVIETGIKHGTVSVIIDDELIEITTMRVDGDYTDNRHPDSVSFTKDILKDLSRRDFTVNAMAYNPKVGLVDPFGGIRDIDNRIIRCVGVADKRFSEDALRIMRAVRFSSTLDFDIEESTAESIIKNKALLNNVASERIRVELLKLLCGRRVYRVLKDFHPVIFEIIPELEPTFNFPQNTPYHIYDVWRHIIVSVASVYPDPILRMTMLLHDIGKPPKHTVDSDGVSHFKGHQQESFEIARDILQRLRFSKAETDEISKLILYHDIRPTGDLIETNKLCCELSPEILLRLLHVFKADAFAQNPDYLDKKLSELEKTKEAVEHLVKSGACFNVTDLKINGDDLIKAGITGKKVGTALNILLRRVVEGKLNNDYNQLLTYIKEYFLQD